MDILGTNFLSQLGPLSQMGGLGNMGGLSKLGSQMGSLSQLGGQIGSQLNTLNETLQGKLSKEVDLSKGNWLNGVEDPNNPHAPRFNNGNEGAELLNSFGSMLKQQMEEVNKLQSQADDAVQTFAVGGPIEVHTVIMALEKADMAVQLTAQVRNKMVSAYQEVMRMQV